MRAKGLHIRISLRRWSACMSGGIRDAAPGSRARFAAAFCWAEGMPASANTNQAVVSTAMRCIPVAPRSFHDAPLPCEPCRAP